MATNNFKPFAIGSGANVSSQADYELLDALSKGFQSGKASSPQINKAIRQATVMANVLSQYISDVGGVDVLDNGVPATILTNLKSAIASLSQGFGLGVNAITITDLNAPTATGFYKYASSALNLPLGAGGQLLHQQFNSTYAAQIVQAVGTSAGYNNRTFTRCLINGTWGEWIELSSSGRLLNTQVFTASGTYTPTAGTKKIYVELVGGGGGGGGVSATASGSIAVAGGGGGGGFASGWYDAPSSASVTVGVGGAGGLGLVAGSGGGQTGGSGGASSFGSLVSASGGEGGPGNGITTTSSGTVTQRVGGLGGVGTLGALLARGGAGRPALATTSGNSISGYGGESFFSGAARGAFGAVSTAINGTDGVAGGGGSGAISDSAPTIGNNTGGKGGNGAVRLWEYA